MCDYNTVCITHVWCYMTAIVLYDALRAQSDRITSTQQFWKRSIKNLRIKYKPYVQMFSVNKIYFKHELIKYFSLKHTV